MSKEVYKTEKTKTALWCWRKGAFTGFEDNAVGFTLIELLIIIAILAFLCMLLLPLLQQSLTIANRSACANNHRQSASACLQYADEFLVLPPSYRSHDLHGPIYTDSSAFLQGVIHNLSVLWIEKITASAQFYAKPGTGNTTGITRHDRYLNLETTLCADTGTTFTLYNPRSRTLPGGIFFPEGIPTTWRVTRPEQRYEKRAWKALTACLVLGTPQVSGGIRTSITLPHRSEGTNVSHVDGSVCWVGNPDYPIWTGYFYNPYGTAPDNGRLASVFWKMVNQ